MVSRLRILLATLAETYVEVLDELVQLLDQALAGAERTREAQRLEKELEDAGIKLSTVATDILGASGRSMPGRVDRRRTRRARARRDGEGTMRPKIPQLLEALTGNFGEHHAFLRRGCTCNASTSCPH